MKKVFKLGLLLAVGLAGITACSGNIPVAPEGTFGNSANEAGYFIEGEGAEFDTLNALAGGSHPPGMKGGPGKGGHGHGPGGFPVELNLTAEQKAQLEALRQENKPPVPDKTKMAEVQKAISDAFLSDTFDAAALKAKLDALKPDMDVHINSEAIIILKTYNILTPEQRGILETKEQEMAAKTPVTRPTPAAADIEKMVEAHLNKLAAYLGLDDTQKASVKVVLQPPAPPDFQAEQAKRKAARDAVAAELKTGNATVEKIAAILKANAPDRIGPPIGDELDRLAKIHDILNADQRQKFNLGKGFGFGPGGHGPKGHGPGGPGNFGGHKGPGPGGPGHKF